MTAPNATQAPSTPDTRTRRAPARRDDRDTSRPRSSSAQRALDRRQKRLEQQRAVLDAGGTLRETPAERALRRLDQDLGVEAGDGLVEEAFPGVADDAEVGQFEDRRLGILVADARRRHHSNPHACAPAHRQSLVPADAGR